MPSTATRDQDSAIDAVRTQQVGEGDDRVVTLEGDERGGLGQLPAAGRLDSGGRIRHRSNHFRNAGEQVAIGDPPEAIFCANDLLAIGVLQGLPLRGVGVPENIALLDIDIDFAESAIVPCPRSASPAPASAPRPTAC